MAYKNPKILLHQRKTILLENIDAHIFLYIVALSCFRIHEFNKNKSVHLRNKPVQFSLNMKFLNYDYNDLRNFWNHSGVAHT